MKTAAAWITWASVLTAFALPVDAAPFVLDDFATNPATFNLNNVTPGGSQNVTGIGDAVARRFSSFNLGGTLANGGTVTLATGSEVAVDPNPGTTISSLLQYSNFNGGATETANSVNVTSGGNTQVSFDFSHVEAGTTFTQFSVFARDQTLANFTFNGLAGLNSLLGSSVSDTSGIYSIPLSSFTGVDFTQLVRLNATIGTGDGRSFALDSINFTPVPEPSCLWLAGSAGAYWLARRRRRQASCD